MKKCPFCGGTGKVVPVEKEKPRVARKVMCQVCTAQGPVKFSDDAALAAWDMREGDGR